MTRKIYLRVYVAFCTFRAIIGDENFSSFFNFHLQKKSTKLLKYTLKKLFNRSDETHY